MDRGESPVRRGERAFERRRVVTGEAVDAKRREKMNDGARAEAIGASRAFARSIAGRGAPRGSFILGVLVHDLAAGAVFRGSPGRGAGLRRGRALRLQPGDFVLLARGRGGVPARAAGPPRARHPAKAARGNARGRGGEECADERDPRTLSDARPRGARGNDPIPRRRPLGLKEQASRRDGARANFAVSSRRAGVSRRGARTRLLLFPCSTPRSSAHDAARGARLSGSLGRSPRPSRSLLFTRPPLTSPSTRALRRWLTRGARALASGARVGIRGGIPEAPAAPPTGRPAPWRYTSKLSAWS